MRHYESLKLLLFHHKLKIITIIIIICITHTHTHTDIYIHKRYLITCCRRILKKKLHIAVNIARPIIIYDDVLHHNII